STIIVALPQYRRMEPLLRRKDGKRTRSTSEGRWCMSGTWPLENRSAPSTPTSISGACTLSQGKGCWVGATTVLSKCGIAGRASSAAPFPTERLLPNLDGMIGPWEGGGGDPTFELSPHLKTDKPLRLIIADGKR